MIEVMQTQYNRLAFIAESILVAPRSSLSHVEIGSRTERLRVLKVEKVEILSPLFLFNRCLFLTLQNDRRVI